MATSTTSQIEGMTLEEGRSELYNIYKSVVPNESYSSTHGATGYGIDLYSESNLGGYYLFGTRANKEVTFNSWCIGQAMSISTPQDDDIIRPFIYSDPDDNNIFTLNLGIKSSSRDVSVLQSSKTYTANTDANRSYIIKDSNTNASLKSVPTLGLQNPYSEQYERNNVSTYCTSTSQWYQWKNTEVYRAGDSFRLSNFTPEQFHSESDYVKTLNTNVPVFNTVEGVVNWVVNGDRSGEIDIDPFGQKFNLYIDAVNENKIYSSPAYKLTWNTVSEEEEVFPDATVKVYCIDAFTGTLADKFTYASARPYLEFEYIEGNCVFTYEDMLRFIADNYEGGRVHQLLKNDIFFYVNVNVGEDKGQVCGCRLKWQAYEESGLYSDISSLVISGYTHGDATLKVFIGTGEGDDGYHKPEDTNNDPGGGNGGFDTTGTLTKTYAMSKERLKQLSDFLWTSSLIENIYLVNNSPIENIISVKAFPFDISGGTDEEIKLGNVASGVNGKPCGSTVSATLGSTIVPHEYENFLDYSPYTNVILHLPFIGFVELDPSMVMGKTVTIKYVADLITGSIKFLVHINLGGKDTVIQEFEGSIGVDISITSSNRAQVEVGHIAAGLSFIGSASTGDVGGAVNSVLQGATCQYHYSTSGSPSPNTNCGEGANRKAYIIVSRPTWDDSKKFNRTYGRMCNLSLKLGDLDGYTVLSNTVSMNDLNATNPEKEELVEILSTGFYA